MHLIQFKAFVRPGLEYSISAWCPFYVKDIDILEKVQRRMTRLLPDSRHLPYEERLQHFRLMTLKTRRLRFDLICVYRILNGFMNVDPSRFLPFWTEIHVVCGHAKKLFLCFSRLDVRRHFFSQRVISTWNELPISCVNAKSVNSFKLELDIFLTKSHFC